MDRSQVIVNKIYSSIGHADYKWCLCGMVRDHRPSTLDSSLRTITEILNQNQIEIGGLVGMMDRSGFPGFVYDGNELKFAHTGCVSIERLCLILPMWILSSELDARNLQIAV